jgi:hypothetical protein
MDDAILFLVRVWHQGQAGFRASARRVDEEDAHLFAEADALARYLADAPIAVATPGPAIARNTSGDAR